VKNPKNKMKRIPAAFRRARPRHPAGQIRGFETTPKNNRLSRPGIENSNQFKVFQTFSNHFRASLKRFEKHALAGA